jgi:hypothetical protein
MLISTLNDVPGQKGAAVLGEVLQPTVRASDVVAEPPG